MVGIDAYLQREELSAVSERKGLQTMRVIITGAAGRIGKQIAEELLDSHDLCLVDRRPVKGQASIVADLSKNTVKNFCWPWSKSRPAPWTESLRGADVVLHLAADPRPHAPWEQVLRDNIQATQNVIEAAVNCRVRRVVFASSNWAVKALEQELAPTCYNPSGPKISSDAPPRPLTLYGTSKAFGELTGRMFVDECQLESFVAVRIGSYYPNYPKNERERFLWIGAQDIRSLFRRCVEAQFEGFHVVYGVSAQPTVPYDLSHTRRLLAWEPQQRP